MSVSGASSSHGSSDDENDENNVPVESLVAGRAKRSTAGNRYAQLAQGEEAVEDLFDLSGEEQDEAFDSDAAGRDADDVAMSSSDSEDGNDADANDEDAGEKELRRKERAEQANKKRKAKQALYMTSAIRKRMKTSAAAAAAKSSTAGQDAEAEAAAKAAKQKKKANRPSWLSSHQDGQVRSSSRKHTVENKKTVRARLQADEAKSAEKKETTAAAAQRRREQRQRIITTEERFAQAAKIERKNLKSFSRWEEAEEKRVAEQRAKIAAMRDRKIEGPSLTWWSGMGTWVNGKLKYTGKRPPVEVIEEDYKQKLQAEPAAEAGAEAAGPQPPADVPTETPVAVAGGAPASVLVNDSQEIQQPNTEGDARTVIERAQQPTEVVVKNEVIDVTEPAVAALPPAIADDTTTIQEETAAKPPSLDGVVTEQEAVKEEVAPEAVPETDPQSAVAETQLESQVAEDAPLTTVAPESTQPPLPNNAESQPAPADIAETQISTQLDTPLSQVQTTQTGPMPTPLDSQPPAPINTDTPMPDTQATHAEPPLLPQPAAAASADGQTFQIPPVDASIESHIPETLQSQAHAQPIEQPNGLPIDQPITTDLATIASNVPAPTSPTIKIEIETSTHNALVFSNHPDFARTAKERHDTMRRILLGWTEANSTLPLKKDLKQKPRCPITRLLATSVDPLTGIKYNGAHAFQSIRGVIEQRYAWSEMLGMFVGSNLSDETATNAAVLPSTAGVLLRPAAGVPARFSDRSALPIQVSIETTDEREGQSIREDGRRE